MKSKKLTEFEMLAHLRVGEVLLSPLIIKNVSSQDALRDSGGDARLELEILGSPEVYRFVVESKSRSTPEVIQSAIRVARRAASQSEGPMIQVPYLSPEQLKELEAAQVSGVDLCGNGIVIVLGRLYVLRTGQPNQYPDSRPLNNPYRGRSAMVARILLRASHWESLSELASAVTHAGEKLSLPQVSKAVQALKEDMIVSKKGGSIEVVDAVRLIDKLGREWVAPLKSGRLTIRLRNKEWAKALSSDGSIRWAVTGESSVTRYAMFSQTGPRQIAVSNFSLAKQLVGGTDEPIPSFADMELIETDSAGFYFDNQIDENGVRWASRLQTWLELQAGDARQREAADDIRKQLMIGSES